MTACDWDVVGCGPCGALDDLEPEAREAIEAWAVDRLWQWTNRRFGACPVTYRPCRKTCDGYSMYGPALVGGRFYNMTCGRCGDSCSCRHVSQIVLPGPIAEPIEILIDGIPLEPLEEVVRVDDYNTLVRTDGGDFPTCQDMGAPTTEMGTWSVTYLQGEPVPPGGDIIAGILACEYAKAICGDSSCRLPKRLTFATRQGITIGTVDRFENLKEGWTGIWEIDDWISAQTRPWQRSTVFSPDVPRPRLMTWPLALS